jgi:hypothetical protein
MEMAHRANLRNRAAFFWIAALTLVLVALLPFALQSVVSDLVDPAEGQVYSLAAPPTEAGTSVFSRLHVAVVAIDELRLHATLRVSGHHDCRTPCDWSTQIVFFSFRAYEAESAGMPPSAAVTLPPSGTAHQVLTETIDLPLRGIPSRYPFDNYQMWLGVAVLEQGADGTVRPVAPDDVQRWLYLTVQEQLPREEMATPEPLDPTAFHDSDDVYQYALVDVLRFTRPMHIKILAVLLVVLIAAAAAYAVFLRPLSELVVSSGGLVLGVWGIRAILSPSNPAYLTAVDLSLSLVILFLLGTITVRALQYSRARTDFHLRHHEDTPPDPTLAGNTCDHPYCANPIMYRCEGCRQAYCPRHVSAGPTPACDVCLAAEPPGREPGELAGGPIAAGVPADGPRDTS